MIFTLTALTKPELDEIVLALNERPYKNVVLLLNKVASQIEGQIAALNPPNRAVTRKRKGATQETG